MLNAWWLAEMAFLVYAREPGFIRDRLGPAGFSDHELIECPPASRWNTRCLWAEHGDFAVAVFRGTEPGNPRDYVTDSRFLPAPLEGPIRVHLGFKEAFEADGVIDRLGARMEAWMRSGRDVWIAGHSLGGALATLAAWRFPGASGAYTFGAPRVGNEMLWKSIEVPVYRVVNFSDLVTMVPTAVRGSYAHGGELKYIDAAGRLHEKRGREGVLTDRLRWPGSRHGEVVGRWWRGETGQIPMRSISDHSPLHYALHLWNNYAAGLGES